MEGAAVLVRVGARVKTKVGVLVRVKGVLVRVTQGEESGSGGAGRVHGEGVDEGD